MVHNLKKYLSFCLLFPSFLMLFWPYALFLFLSIAFIPMFSTWGGEAYPFINQLLDGQQLLPVDVSLLWTIPGILLFGMPIVYCSHAGVLLPCHYMLLDQITQASTTPLGLIAVILTVSITLALVFWSLKCIKHMLDMHWKELGSAMAIFLIATFLAFS